MRNQPFVWAASVVFGAAFGAAHAAEIDFPYRDELGMNLTSPGSGSGEWDFADMYKESSAWTDFHGSAVTYDSQGQPILGANYSETSTYISQGNPNLPTGNYTVTWKGDATVSFTGGWSQVGSTTKDANGIHTAIVQATQTSLNTGQGLRIQLDNFGGTPTRTFTDAHVYQPTYAPGEANAGQTFNQTFTSQLAPFGVVRFKDWMNADKNTIVDDSQRVTPTSPRYTPSISGSNFAGIPVEQMVALANQTNTNPWFSMPMEASADYITKFATYVKDNLNPNLKAYVEYGNEVWDQSKPNGAQYLNSLAVKDFGNSTYGDGFVKEWAKQAGNEFNIWTSVFGASASTKVVRVAALQDDNRYLDPLFLQNLDHNFDVVATAAYFGANTTNYNASTTKEQILQDILKSIASNADATANPNRPDILIGTNAATGSWAYAKQLADYFGKPLVAYEGGQSLSSSTSAAWYQAYLAAERDPEMANVYTKFLQTWFGSVGASLFADFKFVEPVTAAGSWGALEYQGQTDAPKYNALVDFSAGLTAIPEPMAASLMLFGAPLLLWRRRKTA